MEIICWATAKWLCCWLYEASRARSRKQGESRDCKCSKLELIEYKADLDLASVFHRSYIPFVECWNVEFTDMFDQWWSELSEDEQVEINAKVILLQQHGPTLPRPHSDVIVTSRHSNMKELRGKVNQKQLRVLYIFDPRRTALLLLGGDKTGDPKWYEKFVPIADDLFDAHLKEIEKEEK
jgi:hypothetical protein